MAFRIIYTFVKAGYGPGNFHSHGGASLIHGVGSSYFVCLDNLRFFCVECVGLHFVSNVVGIFTLFVYIHTHMHFNILGESMIVKYLDLEVY